MSLSHYLIYLYLYPRTARAYSTHTARPQCDPRECREIVCGFLVCSSVTFKSGAAPAPVRAGAGRCASPLHARCRWALALCVRCAAAGYTTHTNTKRHSLTPHVQHSARKLQRTRRSRRAQCAGARQRRACADSFIWAGKHAAASCGTRSRERARKTHARARCIGRECAERCLQGRRPAAPPPLARDARAQRPLRRCRSRAPFPWQRCERR